MKRDFTTINTEIYMAAKILAGKTWKIVETWDYYARDNFGDDLTRASDSFADFVSRATINGIEQERHDYARRARAQYFEMRALLRKAYAKDSISDDDLDGLLIIMEKLEPELKQLVERLNKGPRI